jgi:hypothetical protein
VFYFTCIDIRLSDRVRSFDCTIRSTLPLQGFPVIVKPTIVGYDYIRRVVFPVLVTAKVYVITSPTFPVPPTAAVFTRAMRGLCQWGIRRGIVCHVAEISVTLFPLDLSL